MILNSPSASLFRVTPSTPRAEFQTRRTGNFLFSFFFFLSSGEQLAPFTFSFVIESTLENRGKHRTGFSLSLFLFFFFCLCDEIAGGGRNRDRARVDSTLLFYSAVQTNFCSGCPGRSSRVNRVIDIAISLLACSDEHICTETRHVPLEFLLGNKASLVFVY